MSALPKVVANTCLCAFQTFWKERLLEDFVHHPQTPNIVTRDLLSFIQLMQLAVGEAVKLSS